VSLATPTAGPTFGADPTVNPTPTPGPTYVGSPSYAPDPTPYHSPAATPSGPFAMDLYEDGDFVSEAEAYMCLPAAMQVMINVMRPGLADTSRKYQNHLYALARTYLPADCTHCATGATPEGWAGGLNDEGYGPYEMRILPTMVEAIQLSAKRMRLTGKPVGLLTWRGAHSWAVSGFVSDKDPLLGDDFVVSGIYVEDVWYPRISSIWGPSDPPDTLVGMDRLHVDFRKYNRPRQEDPDKDYQYVVIVPVARDGG
jgi:hypothetical protein